MPLVGPLVVRQVGVQLAHIHTVPTLLAGSRLGWDPIRNARPHIAAATLVALTLTVLGYQKLTNAEIRSGHAPPVALVTVNINVATADEIGQLASELRPAVVAVFREDANRWIVGANCQEISRHIAGMGCDQNSPADFDSTGELRMSQALGLPSQLDLVLAPDLRLGTEWHEHTGSESATHEHAPSDLSQTSHFHDGLLVIDSTTSPADLEQSVGTLTTTALPGSSVLGVSRFRRYYPPSWSWTVAGLAMAAAVLEEGTSLRQVGQLANLSENAVGPRLARTARLMPRCITRDRPEPSRSFCSSRWLGMRRSASVSPSVFSGSSAPKSSPHSSSTSARCRPQTGR